MMIVFKENLNRGFPGGPVVKTSPPNLRGVVRYLVRVLRSHMPHSQKTKRENGLNTVINSIKTLKSKIS